MEFQWNSIGIPKAYQRHTKGIPKEYQGMPRHTKGSRWQVRVGTRTCAQPHLVIPILQPHLVIPIHVCTYVRTAPAPRPICHNRILSTCGNSAGRQARTCVRTYVRTYVRRHGQTPKFGTRDPPGGAKEAPRAQECKLRQNDPGAGRKHKFHSFPLVQGISHQIRQFVAPEACRATGFFCPHPGHIW